MNAVVVDRGFEQQAVQRLPQVGRHQSTDTLVHYRTPRNRADGRTNDNEEGQKIWKINYLSCFRRQDRYRYACSCCMRVRDMNDMSLYSRTITPAG